MNHVSPNRVFYVKTRYVYAGKGRPRVFQLDEEEANNMKAENPQCPRCGRAVSHRTERQRATCEKRADIRTAREGYVLDGPDDPRALSFVT